MPDRPNLVYTYDGSFEGFLCCVFESYAMKEIPRNILSPSGQPALFDFSKGIETDTIKAKRVYESIPIRISADAQELVKLGFLTCVPQKELLIFRFLQLGYKVGGRIMSMLTDDRVYPLQKAVNQLTHESHKFTGFIRFSVFKVVHAEQDRSIGTPATGVGRASIFREDSLSVEKDPAKDKNSHDRTSGLSRPWTGTGTSSSGYDTQTSILEADLPATQAAPSEIELYQQSSSRPEISALTRTSNPQPNSHSLTVAASAIVSTGHYRFELRTSKEALVSVIEPKNFVLPLLSTHFCDRYRNEMFMIYDKTHKAALIYQEGKTEIIQVDNLVLPETDREEEDYRRLWKRFYETISIESRFNPRCRMTLMPKRYWGNMTEFS